MIIRNLKMLPSGGKTTCWLKYNIRFVKGYDHILEKMG